jgi:hypothetical protein
MKYRIVEETENGKSTYYPEYKSSLFSCWSRFYTKRVAGIVSGRDLFAVQFGTQEDAKMCIEDHIEVDKKLSKTPKITSRVISVE